MLLEKNIAQKLTKKRLTLAIAESCTGGLLSHSLTNIPGSSLYFKGSIIVYSNESKTKLLNIPPKLLKRDGAVSEATALLMAQNIRKIFHSTFGLGITGIAGPSGGTPLKPVGLTFIDISTPHKSLSLRCLFKGSRLKIKKQASTKALRLLSQFLK